MSELPTLKPCPFCGEKAEIETRNLGDGEIEVIVDCPECNCAVVADSEKEAAEEWNMRPIEDQLREDLKNMRSMGLSEVGAIRKENQILREALEKMKCDVCGRFVSLKDLASGKARREMTLPDSDYSIETYETFCRKCNRYEPISSPQRGLRG